MIEYVRGILSRPYWLLRMRCWLWREKRTVARLKIMTLALGADRFPPVPGAADASSPGACIPEVAGDLRSQSLLLGGGENIIKPRSSERSLEDQSLGRENERRALREREAQLIAEYDAHFLASLRIKSPVPQLFV